MPEVEIIGVYPLQVTPELIEEAFDLKYGGIELDSAARREAERAVREELSSVVLVEVSIKGCTDHLDVGHFGQSDRATLGPNDQVAYDEVFLSEDGREIIGHEFSEIESRNVRLAFFLHYFDAGKPILTSFGPVNPPKPSPMPQRLANLIKYEPVD